MHSAIRTETDRERVDGFLQRLSTDHASAEMREARPDIPGTDIVLWATCELVLGGGVYRVTWRYEDRDGDRVIVCFTLAQV